MLYEFLEKYKNPIIQLSAEKTLNISENKPVTSDLKKGLPIFYQDLTDFLKKDASNVGPQIPASQEDSMLFQAGFYGKESHRLGYTISQVIHGYGSICQAITEYAQEKNFLISSREFHELNHYLDLAIAQAVTQYTNVTKEDTERKELLRLGELAHELRNALGSAIIAHEMIIKGTVGGASNTSCLLSRALSRMRDLIDRSLSEVRLRIASEPHFQTINIIDVISDIEATAVTEARSKGIDLSVEVDAKLQVNCDRQLLESALANLVQNALKYTKPKSHIWVRCMKLAESVVIEVEDECGGLPEGKSEELFRPYTQKDADKSGLGLGLTISQRAIQLNKGKLSVTNKPGRGCVFIITLPHHVA